MGIATEPVTIITDTAMKATAIHTMEVLVTVIHITRTVCPYISFSSSPIILLFIIWLTVVVILYSC